MREYVGWNFIMLIAGLCTGCVAPDPDEVFGYSPELNQVDQYTLKGEKHFIDDLPPLDSHGNINVVVEIPTGSNAKWEVDKTTGVLRWEFLNGRPRIVSYLGYPGNYGMVPGTLLSNERGGDGDPVDVLVLGSALPRGSVIGARVIGILKLLDDDEQDDKIIAVQPGSDLGRIYSINDLEREFNGITEIIEIWFSNYKGPNRMKSKGFGGVEEGQALVKSAIKAYKL